MRRAPFWAVVAPTPRPTLWTASLAASVLSAVFLLVLGLWRLIGG